jgi:hypothetical protein
MVPRLDHVGIQLAGVGRWLAVVAFVATAACRSGEPPRLQGGTRSVEGLVEQFVEALNRGDTAAMHRLRVTEWEHNTLLWPEFPASRPELNMPVEFAWFNLSKRSVRDAARLARQYRNAGIRPVATTCRKQIQQYATFEVHGDCVVTLVDKFGVRHRDAQLFGSLVKMDGRFKIIGILAD